MKQFVDGYFKWTRQESECRKIRLFRKKWWLLVVAMVTRYEKYEIPIYILLEIRLFMNLVLPMNGFMKMIHIIREREQFCPGDCRKRQTRHGSKLIL